METLRLNKKVFASRKGYFSAKAVAKRERKEKERLAQRGVIRYPESSDFVAILGKHREFVKGVVKTFGIETLVVFPIAYFEEQQNSESFAGEVFPLPFHEKKPRITYRFLDRKLGYKQDIAFYCRPNIFMGIQQKVSHYDEMNRRGIIKPYENSSSS